jgi:internalin A
LLNYRLLQLVSLEVKLYMEDKLKEAVELIDSAKRDKRSHLNLSGLGLIELPPSLGCLTNLTYLNLSGNNLTTCPNILGKLSQLNELNLSNNKLTEFPAFLLQLTNITELDISSNRLIEIPDSIILLDKLNVLDISFNRLTDLPDSLTEMNSIQFLNISNNEFHNIPCSINHLKNLISLDVSGNMLRGLPDSLANLPKIRRLIAARIGLEALPKWVLALKNLEVLSVSDNQLTHLPSTIENLKSLKSFCVASNRLKELPKSITKLTALEYLSLGRNPIVCLPDSMNKLTMLRGLDLNTEVCVLYWEEGRKAWRRDKKDSSANLESLPVSMRNMPLLSELFLHGQKKLGLPPEVMGPTWNDLNDITSVGTVRKAASPESILNYYFSKTIGSPLNEAKMILVGRGGVGKTSLVNRLVNSCYNPSENKTDGIAITPWFVRVGEDQVRLNIWDFGGQEIMHATHQFFLTKRSLYLLVLNAREGEQDANIEYWLRMIESFGGNSPVLIVINKINDHYFDLNRRGLQMKFPSIRGFIQTDCEAGMGMDDLREAILQETDRLEHLRDPFPVSWFEVKDTLSNLPKTEGKSFIPYVRYQEICLENNLTDPVSQETLVGFLHDLGIVVNFRDDPRLAETHVLNPEWVTNGIYKILNAKTLAAKAGELHLNDLTTILNEQEYPRMMHPFLLDLMRKFELCYPFYETNESYLVPELLGKEEPDLQQYETQDALYFEYHYNIIPEGLLPRFIVRSRALNRNLPRWRTGVVLFWDNNYAVVKADVQDKLVSIVITGQPAGRRRLLSVIRADLEHIHSSFNKLQAILYVPVPNHPGHVIRYEDLCAYEAAGITHNALVAEGQVIQVNIHELLEGIDETPLCKGWELMHGAARLVFSYSHKDEELRDELETQLKLLQRQGFISMWHDRKITPSNRWAGVIDVEFERADIILLLISADFLASDYCYETEMMNALEREKKGETKVVPIVIRACNWKGALFSGLQGLPTDLRPVTSWPNRDEAWNDVAKGIRNLVEEIGSRRVT